MSFVHVAPTSYYSSATATRPNNTTAYAAGDVVGATAAVWTFKTAGPAADRLSRVDGAVLTITSVRFEIDVIAVPAGMTSFRLYLYASSPTSALADGDAWDLPANDRAKHLGYVDLGTPVDLGSTLWVQQTELSAPFKLATGSSALYGYLVTNGAYTPTAQAVKRIDLYGVAA